MNKIKEIKDIVSEKTKSPEMQNGLEILKTALKGGGYGVIIACPLGFPKPLAFSIGFAAGAYYKAWKIEKTNREFEKVIGTAIVQQ